MWLKFYRDYPVDTPLIKNRVQSGQGIIGCEMHELNGWGNTLHHSARDWRLLDDAKRKPHVGDRDSLPPMSEMQADY